MEEALSHPVSRQPGPLFNSELETGLRALVVLEAFYPRRCSLMEMTWFDHLVVHTADIDGPSSLHPDLAPRLGELFVRRRLVEDSLNLMRGVHMVDIRHDDDGIHFQASEDAPSFLGMLQSPYIMSLKERARWLAERFAQAEPAEIERVVRGRIGRLRTDFQVAGSQGEAAS